MQIKLFSEVIILFSTFQAQQFRMLNDSRDDFRSSLHRRRLKILFSSSAGLTLVSCTLKFRWREFRLRDWNIFFHHSREGRKERNKSFPLFSSSSLKEKSIEEKLFHQIAPSPTAANHVKKKIYWIDSFAERDGAKSCRHHRGNCCA